MQFIAVIHVIMGGNFKQFCLLLFIHLDCLVELFPRLSDLNAIMYNLRYEIE